MVTVRGRKQSLAPQMRPPTRRPVRVRRTSESEEDELLEADSTVSNEINEATFIAADGDVPDASVRNEVETESDCGTTPGPSEPSEPSSIESREATSVSKTVAAVATSNTEQSTQSISVPSKSECFKTSKPVSGPKLNNSLKSNDSGNSEPMDTEDRSDVEDDSISGLFACVSAVEEQVKVNYPVTARPPCVVDCSMVQERVVRTQKTLELEVTAEKLTTHAEQMAKHLRVYVDSVKACFNHLNTVAGAAKRDEDQVMMRTLNKSYGLPETHLTITDKMYPTLPSNHISKCSMGARYFAGYPLDKQANLVALAYIMVKGYQQQNQRSYSAVVNEGDVQFGDPNFRGLNSYRTTGRKMVLGDFGHYFRPDNYFNGGEADLAQLGTDVYALCGMVSSNLALNVRVPTFTKRLMDGCGRVTKESIRRSLVAQMEKNAENPSLFLDELSHIIYDMHDYQALSKKISKESIGILTFIGRTVRNAMDSEMSKRRAQYAQRTFAKELQTMFTTDCKLKSLFSRVNRCLKDYFNTTFGGVDGFKVNQSPSLKIDIPAACVSFTPDFTGSWGGQGGVHSDLFMSFRDNIKDKYCPGITPSYEPKDDSIRVPIGSEFSYAFGPSTFKRPRTPSNSRVTPDGKSRLTRSVSERGALSEMDSLDPIDLTGVRRASRLDKTLTPADNLKAWEQSHGI